MPKCANLNQCARMAHTHSETKVVSVWFITSFRAIDIEQENFVFAPWEIWWVNRQCWEIHKKEWRATWTNCTVSYVMRGWKHDWERLIRSYATANTRTRMCSFWHWLRKMPFYPVTPNLSKSVIDIRSPPKIKLRHFKSQFFNYRYRS